MPQRPDGDAYVLLRASECHKAPKHLEKGTRALAQCPSTPMAWRLCTGRAPGHCQKRVCTRPARGQFFGWYVCPEHSFWMWCQLELQILVLHRGGVLLSGHWNEEIGVEERRNFRLGFPWSLIATPSSSKPEKYILIYSFCEFYQFSLVESEL